MHPLLKKILDPPLNSAIITAFSFSCFLHPRSGGGGILPSNRLMEMCRWIDYNGVTFSLELLEWDRTFSIFGGSENSGW